MGCLKENVSLFVAFPVGSVQRTRPSVAQKEKMKRLNKILLAAVIVGATVAKTQAAFDTNVTNIASDASTLFTAVIGVAVTITAARIGLWVVRKIRS